MNDGTADFRQPPQNFSASGVVSIEAYEKGALSLTERTRARLAYWILGIVGGLLVAEVLYAMFGPGCPSLQATLDSFGLFDASIFGIAGAVVAFYFSERRSDF